MQTSHHAPPAVSLAYQRASHVDRAASSKSFKIALVALDCIFLGARPLPLSQQPHLPSPPSSRFCSYPPALSPHAPALAAAHSKLLPRLHWRTGLQPVLVHMSKNKKGTYSFDPVSVNFMVELTKTVYALITLLIFVSVILASWLGRG